MILQLYATYRKIAGRKTVALELPDGTTVRQAVTALAGALPALGSYLLEEQGQIRAHVQIFVNGQDTRSLAEGRDTPLQTNDVLDIFPPVGGGSA